MFKPQIGDFIFMALAVVTVVAMLLLGSGGGKTADDPEAEKRSIETYLGQLDRRMSPALTVAIIIGLSGVAYVLLAIYARAT